MVRNEVVPQLRFSPPRLLPSGVFQLAGNVRIVSDERHDYGHMFAMQGGPRSARVVPNTKIALDPLYPTPRRQPKFRVSGYSGGLTALKTHEEDGEGAAAIKDAVQLDHLQVHVSNKSPYTVSIECSIGGIVKQMIFNRGAARFNGLALDWRAEALTLLAAVVDDGLANCGKQSDPAASTVDEEQQLPSNRDGSAELDFLKNNIDVVSSSESFVRGRNSISLERCPETLAIHGGRRHLEESLDRYYGKPPIGDEMVQLSMMEKEFTCLSTVIEALEEASQRTNALDRDTLLFCIDFELPGDIRSNHEVVSLISQIRDAPENREAASHAAKLKMLLQKVNSIQTSNHGGIVTDLKTEWYFVVDPESIAEKLNMPELNSRGICPVTGKPFPKRRPTHLEYYLSHELTNTANLTKPEVVGLRLYSGPSYQAINCSLRQVVKDEMAQNLRQSKSLQKDPPGEALLSSTSVLRHFVVTANAVNSALKKLAALTPPTPGRRLYRGLSQLSFESALLSNESLHGRLAEHVGTASAKAIFVEPGFSSATPRLDVALSYCGETSSTLLEIETGGVDHGASLSWISQFPDEDEHTIMALSAFEVVAMRTVSRAYMRLEASLQANTRLFVNLHKLKNGVRVRKSLTMDKLLSKENHVKAARVGMPNPMEQLKLKVLFSQLDKDGDGCITLPEFTRYLAELHVGMSEQEEEELFQFIDEDKNGLLEYAELEMGFEEKSFHHQPRMKKLHKAIVSKRNKQMQLQKDMSKPRVLDGATFDDYINVLTVKLNVNRSACTSEELLSRRRSTIVDLYRDLKLEALCDRYCGAQVVCGLDDLWKRKYQGLGAHDFLHILRFQTAVFDLIGVWTSVLHQEQSKALRSMEDCKVALRALTDKDITQGEDDETIAEKSRDLAQRLETDAAKVVALGSFDDSSESEARGPMESSQNGTQVMQSSLAEAGGPMESSQNGTRAMQSSLAEAGGPMESSQNGTQVMQSSLAEAGGPMESSQNGTLAMQSSLAEAGGPVQSSQNGTRAMQSSLAEARGPMESSQNGTRAMQSSLAEAGGPMQSSQNGALEAKRYDPGNVLRSVLEIFNSISLQLQRQHGADGLVYTCRLIQKHGLKDNSMQNAKYIMKQVILTQCEKYPCLPWLVSVEELVSLMGRSKASSAFKQQLEERRKGRVDISSIISYMKDPCPSTATQEHEKTFKILSNLLKEYEEEFKQALDDKKTVSRFAQAVQCIESLKARMRELAGAVQFILAAMEANEGRVKQGCSLLLTMVSLPKEDPSYIAEERDLVLVELEAQAEGIVRIIEKYPEHESVRTDAVQVLRRMWAEDEGTARSKLLMFKQQIKSKPAAQMLEDVFQVVKGGRKR